MTKMQARIKIEELLIFVYCLALGLSSLKMTLFGIQVSKLKTVASGYHLLHDSQLWLVDCLRLFLNYQNDLPQFLLRLVESIPLAALALIVIWIFAFRRLVNQRLKKWLLRLGLGYGSLYVILILGFIYVFSTMDLYTGIVRVHQMGLILTGFSLLIVLASFCVLVLWLVGLVAITNGIHYNQNDEE